MVKAITIITLRQTNSVFQGMTRYFWQLCARSLLHILPRKHSWELKIRQSLASNPYLHVWICLAMSGSCFIIHPARDDVTQLMALSSQICPPCVIGHDSNSFAYWVARLLTSQLWTIDFCSLNKSRNTDVLFSCQRPQDDYTSCV
jgi:hypothetical protein